MAALVWERKAENKPLGAALYSHLSFPQQKPAGSNLTEQPTLGEARTKCMEAHQMCKWSHLYPEVGLKNYHGRLTMF